MRSTPTTPVKSALSNISGASSWPLSSSSAHRVVVAPMSAIKSTAAPSGVQVRDPRALELRDHVFEHQLALLEPLQHELIHVWIANEPGDDLVEVSVLYTQLLEPLHVPEGLSFYFVGH